MKREERASACVLIENKHISEGLKGKRESSMKIFVQVYVYTYIYIAIGVYVLRIHSHTYVTTLEEKEALPPKTTPTRSFPLVGRFSPVSYGRASLPSQCSTVVWVASEKFRSLLSLYLPPSVPPSFLPTLRFVPSSSTSSSLDNPG